MFNFLYLVFSISSDNNNTSACYINMEVISNEQPPRYAQVVQSSTTTNLAGVTTNLAISRHVEEPPPSYDTVIVQLARGLDRSCSTNIIR